MIQILLEQLHFFAYHGLYPEERILGNNYTVDIHVTYLPNTQLIRSIDQTIDYSIVYEMIAKRMKEPTALLETIATEFCYQLMEKFVSVQTIQFSIKKFNPPITKYVGNVGVSFQLKRSEI
jgi:dihydroneopterin aldolase